MPIDSFILMKLSLRIKQRLSMACEGIAFVEAALVQASRLRQVVLKSAFEGRLSSSVCFQFLNQLLRARRKSL
jgi:hypothetical protein